MKMKLGIIGAMESEVELLVSLLEEKECRTVGKHTYYTGILSGTPTVIARAGVGKVNAAVCTAAALFVKSPALSTALLILSALLTAPCAFLRTVM